MRRGDEGVVYKVSIVIPGADHGGAIINTPNLPQVGDHLQVGDLEVEILELMELIPPRGEFRFLHATCKEIAIRPAATTQPP